MMHYLFVLFFGVSPVVYVQAPWFRRCRMSHMLKLVDSSSPITYLAMRNPNFDIWRHPSFDGPSPPFPPLYASFRGSDF